MQLMVPVKVYVLVHKVFARAREIWNHMHDIKDAVQWDYMPIECSQNIKVVAVKELPLAALIHHWLEVLYKHKLSATMGEEQEHFGTPGFNVVR